MPVTVNFKFIVLLQAGPEFNSSLVRVSAASECDLKLEHYESLTGSVHKLLIAISQFKFDSGLLLEIIFNLKSLNLAFVCVKLNSSFNCTLTQCVEVIVLDHTSVCVLPPDTRDGRASGIVPGPQVST